MFINLTNIDFCPGSGGGSANLQEDKSVTYTTNGSYTIQPDEGYDGLSSVGVTVNYDGTDYRNQNGTVDVDGLKALGWDTETINYFNANALHYPWENDKYLVSDGNKALYGVVNKDNVSSYKSDPNFIYCPYFDTSSMNSMSLMFENCNSLVSIPKLDTSNVTDIYGLSGMFKGCNSLVSMPKLDTSKVMNMASMFNGCTALQSIPLLDTSNVLDMGYMFENCTALQSIPLLDTSKVMYMNYMLRGCSSLKTIPPFNTSNVTDMNSMFSGCTSLQAIPLLNTSNVTNMGTMFSNCTKLQSIPLLNTSNVTEMEFMFNECHSLRTIPQLDVSNVEDMQSMFYQCDSLRSIPELNTSNVKNMYRMFDGWFSSMYIERIEGLDMSSLTSTPDYMFRQCYSLSYLRLNGSLGKSLDLSYSSKLDYDSVKSVLTAASNTTNTDSKTLKFNSTLTDQNGELAALVSTCTAKGWTISGLTLN